MVSRLSSAHSGSDIPLPEQFAILGHYLEAEIVVAQQSDQRPRRKTGLEGESENGGEKVGHGSGGMSPLRAAQ